MDKTKITGHQLWAMVTNFSCGTSIIIISSGLAGFAKQDAWISALAAIVIGLFFVWMYSYLGSLYPGKSFVEIICSVFGKWLGIIVSAGFIFLCLLDVPEITWYTGNFMQTQYTPETPLYALNALFIAVLVIALLYGLGAIARSFEIFVYIISGMFILSMILVLPNAKFENLQPVLEEGIVPILKGSVLLSSYMTWPLIVLNMIYPFKVANRKQARKSYFLGYLWGAAMIFISSLMSILVLGSTIAARSQYPVYLLAKEINVGIIFTRVEGVIAGIWILGMFSKTLLYFYCGVIGLSQLLGLKDYRKIVIPLGLISLVLSGVVYPDILYEAKWDSTTWIVFVASFGAVLPIVLLIVTLIKKWLRNS